MSETDVSFYLREHDWEAKCEGGACVESRVFDGWIYLRNSERPEEVVAFTEAEWLAFIPAMTRDDLRVAWADEVSG